MGKKKASKPVEKPEVAPELVDPARLNHGEPEGDIAASYSADKICDGKPIRKPFPWRGGLWVCTSSGPGDRHEAYRPLASAAELRHYAVAPTTYSERVHGNDDFGERARRDPNGFYHGVTVQHAGRSYVMTGPKVIFMPGEVGQSALFAPAEHVDRAGSMPPIAGSSGSGAGSAVRSRAGLPSNTGSNRTSASTTGRLPSAKVLCSAEPPRVTCSESDKRKELPVPRARHPAASVSGGNLSEIGRHHVGAVRASLGSDREPRQQSDAP